MSEHDDDLKAKLLSLGLEEADLEVEGVGTVRVRGLTRAEAFRIQQVDGQMEKDALTIALGLINPKLTMDEIKGMQRRIAAGRLEPITDKIGELSKVTKADAKAVYKNFEDNPGDEFRIHAGGETLDDGVAATGANA